MQFGVSCCSNKYKRDSDSDANLLMIKMTTMLRLLTMVFSNASAHLL